MAYGDNRSEVFNDTFDSSIDGNYENGGGDWDPLVWATGGVIQASAGAFASCAIRRTTTVNDDQYCQVVSATQSGDTYTACIVRMAAGTDESSYIGYSAHFESNYQIWESDSAFGFNLLASTATGWGALLSGEILTMEAEGSTLRLGDNNSGSDTEYLTTTDATISSGSIGCHLSVSTGAEANAEITQLIGGNISAGGGAGQTVSLLHRNQLRHMLNR